MSVSARSNHTPSHANRGKISGRMKIAISNLLAERQSTNEIHDSLAQTLYYANCASLLLDAMKSDNDLRKCAQISMKR
jgi:hypothetical protein